jgi:hypothetical protein
VSPRRRRDPRRICADLLDDVRVFDALDRR